MADDVVVRFRADLGDAQVKLTELEKKVNNLASAYDKANTSINRSNNKTVSSFNTLGNSINQLSREIPAFAITAQTGFLAISNNIPALSDAISQLRAKNEALKASGQASIPIWKSVASALFSWQTAMSVGITLLTLYGKEIVDFISNLFRAEKQITRNAEVQEKLNKISENAINNTLKETTELKILLNITKDTNNSYEQRKNAVDKLQKLYPTFLGNLSDEKILTGDVTKEVNGLTEALLKRARAEAAVAEIVQNEKRINELSKEAVLVAKQIKNSENSVKASQEAADASIYSSRANDFAIKENIRNQKELDSARIKAVDINAEIADLQAQNNALLKQGAEGTKELLKAEKARDPKKQKEINLDIEFMDDELEKVVITSKELFKISQDFNFFTDEDFENAEKIREKWEKIAKTRALAFQTSIDLAGKLTEITGNLTQTEINAIEAKKEAELNAIEEKNKKGSLSDKQYSDNKLSIEKKYDSEIASLKMQQLEREKISSTFQAIIKGGLATLQAFLELGPIGGALTASAIAAEVVAINTAPLPQFEKGGEIKGKRHLQGGVLIEAEGGEFINNRISTMKYKEELESANNFSLEKLIQRKYVLPALKKQGQSFANAIHNNFNDTNLLMSDQKSRELLRDIRDTLKVSNKRQNPRFRNV